MCRPGDIGLKGPATQVRDNKQGSNTLMLLKDLGASGTRSRSSIGSCTQYTPEKVTL